MRRLLLLRARHADTKGGMLRGWIFLIFALICGLPERAQATAAAPGCLSEVLMRADAPTEERELLNKLLADRQSEAELRGRLEAVQEELSMNFDSPRAPELEYRSSQILEVLDKVAARAKDREAELKSRLAEASEALERRTMSYLKGSQTEASGDLVRLARHVLDLQGVSYKLRLVDGKHLTLEILESDVKGSALWIQKVRARRELPVRFIFSPSYQNEQSAVALTVADSSVVYIDAETIARGRLSPSGVHEFQHLLSQRVVSKNSPEMRSARLHDAAGPIPRDESRAYSVEAVARYLDLRSRLDRIKKRNLGVRDPDMNEFVQIWKDYLLGFTNGRDFALRSAKVLQEFKPTLGSWSAVLGPSPLFRGELRLAVTLPNGKIQYFPTRARTLEEAILSVSKSLPPEIAHDLAIAEALKNAHELQWIDPEVAPSSFSVSDFEERLNRSVPAMRALWTLSRQKSKKI